MIRIQNYKQPTTGVPLEWWEIRGIVMNYIESVTLPDGRKMDVPEDSPADQRNFPAGTVHKYRPRIFLKYGGYFLKPEPGDEAIMPVSVVVHELPEDESRQLEKLFDGVKCEIGSIYNLADHFAVKVIEAFKGGVIGG